MALAKTKKILPAVNSYTSFTTVRTAEPRFEELQVCAPQRLPWGMISGGYASSVNCTFLFSFFFPFLSTAKLLVRLTKAPDVLATPEPGAVLPTHTAGLRVGGHARVARLSAGRSGECKVNDKILRALPSTKVVL